MIAPSPFLCLALAFASTATCAIAQPLTWHVNPVNGHYYALTASAMSWGQASVDATRFRGRLVQIEDAVEEAWLLATFGSQQTGYWIGLSDDELEGIWVWSDASPAAYRNWCPNEPSLDTSRNFAAVVQGVNSCFGQWMPQTASQQWFGVIETEVAPPGIAGVTEHGAGCPSTTGAVPEMLQARPDSLPGIGHNFDMTVPMTLFGPIPAVIGTVGFNVSNVPLDNFGMPGCVSLNSPVVLGIPMVNDGVRANLSLPVPADPNLVGVQVVFQTAVIQAGLNPLGVLTTNALIATVGTQPL